MALSSDSLNIIIENVEPIIDGGEYVAKTVVGQRWIVEADIFKDGQEPLQAFLLYKKKRDKQFMRAPMRLIENDRWQGVFVPTENTRYLYTIEAQGPRRPPCRYQKKLELMVDRKQAVYSTWYEFFPRSQGSNPSVSATFKDCVIRLEEIKRMGFNVVYLPPIHPIGQTQRKAGPQQPSGAQHVPGSPWAIGSREGGHKAIHPDLGGFSEFKIFLDAAKAQGMEVALDLAFQCSPDHPYVKEHPEWFLYDSDGHIRCAENPPKKYEDVYPLDFYCANWQELWQELKSIVLFWIEKGINIFRVDNPHTKPLLFWKWLIDEIQQDHPQVIFLSEAFTRPTVMKFLAKAGFTQSYTYFTWRNTKTELRTYLKELMTPPMPCYFRGNFFTNTPDIITEYLQKGGQAAFKIRAVLAATLSSIYGIYSGFELCENQAAEAHSEEYAHSEKFQIKPRDWNSPGNIKDFIARLNAIREANLALQQYDNLEFYETFNEPMLCYGKRTADNTNKIVVVVNLDCFAAHDDMVRLPLYQWGMQDGQTYCMRDLLQEARYTWKGTTNYVRLDPAHPAHIFLMEDRPSLL